MAAHEEAILQKQALWLSLRAVNCGKDSCRNFRLCGHLSGIYSVL